MFSLILIVKCSFSCLNGGTCLSNACICLDGYTGKNCGNKYSCSDKCLNGGTCLNSTCICSDGYTGKDCEYEYLDRQPVREIRFITANEISNFSVPFFKTGVIKDYLYYKFSSGCPSNVTLLQENVNRTIEFIMVKRPTNGTIIEKNDSSMFKISVSCHQFRNISISWKGDVFTFGTMHLFDNKLWRKTVENYSQKGFMYQAQFSSGVNTEWTLFKNDANDLSVSFNRSSNQTYEICPIFEERREFRVTILNNSPRCSQQITVECNNDRLAVQTYCSVINDICNDYLRYFIWITVCTAHQQNSCNRCKVKNFRFGLMNTCSVAAYMPFICKQPTRYMIMWYDIRVEEQSSTTKILPTIRPFISTSKCSGNEPCTVTVEEQSTSTRSLQTTRSLTPTYSEHVFYTSTATNIKDKDFHSMSGNQKVIGLTIGASISAVIIVILLICLLMVIRRRSIERNSAKKIQILQTSKDGNDYTGRQNFALPMHEDLTEYNQLAMRRDSHQYGVLTSVGKKPNETTYDYIDHHKQKQETDICKIDQKNSKQDPGDELIHDYSVLDPNEKTLNTVKVMSNTGRDVDTYAVLDPDESTTLCSGTENSDRLDKPKDEAYAVLDPNITGFDRTENVAKIESAETYTVLDPSITGFNRSDLTHRPGDMTMDHVNKKSLIQPYKEDGTDYEFAKPIDDDMSSKSCLSSYRDRANSGGSYGTYQTGNTHRLHDINQQNSEENVYNRTVDDVYDSADHNKMPNSRDDTYDHFSGEKKND